MSAADDELRTQAVTLINKYFNCNLSPEHNSLIYDLMTAVDAHDKALLDRVRTEVIGEDEKSEHIRRFQCPNYGNGCYEWAEQWKMNSEPPYCSTDGRKMKSVEFDQEAGDDWTRNELRTEMRNKLNALLPSGGVEGEHHDDSK